MLWLLLPLLLLLMLSSSNELATRCYIASVRAHALVNLHNVVNDRCFDVGGLRWLYHSSGCITHTSRHSRHHRRQLKGRRRNVRCANGGDNKRACRVARRLARSCCADG